MSDLIERLRGLAACEHDDHSVAEEAADEIERLRGAMRAADERLLDAAKRAGIPTFGCDTAEHLAAEVERLREAHECAVDNMQEFARKLCAGTARAEAAESALAKAREALALRIYLDTCPKISWANLKDKTPWLKEADDEAEEEFQADSLSAPAEQPELPQRCPNCGCREFREPEPYERDGVCRIVCKCCGNKQPERKEGGA